MVRECIECSASYDPRSPAKIRAGGRINTCPDCSTETSVRYLGLTAGDGKQAGITVLAFKTQQDREAYASFWKNNSGLHVGKACQLGSHLSTTPNLSYRTVTQSTATNHKGRMA